MAHQSDLRPLLIQVTAMGKCKQANEFEEGHHGHPSYELFMIGVGMIHDSRLPYLNFNLDFY